MKVHGHRASRRRLLAGLAVLACLVPCFLLYAKYVNLGPYRTDGGVVQVIESHAVSRTELRVRGAAPRLQGLRDSAGAWPSAGLWRRSAAAINSLRCQAHYALGYAVRNIHGSAAHCELCGLSPCTTLGPAAAACCSHPLVRPRSLRVQLSCLATD